jgi:flagellar biosynthesis/type III secretory pathway M-ring protein FliF/YscJ
MQKIHNTSGFIRSEWMGIAFVLLLGLSFMIRFVNIWIKSGRLTELANVVAAIPAVALLIGFVAFLIARPFLDRHLERELTREEASQQPHAETTSETAPSAASEASDA